MEHIARPAPGAPDIWVIHGCTGSALWRAWRRRGRSRLPLERRPKTLCGQPLPRVDEERPLHVDVTFCPECSAAGAFKGETPEGLRIFPPDANVAVFHQSTPLRDRRLVWAAFLVDLLRLPAPRTSCALAWTAETPLVPPGTPVQACGICTVIHGTDPSYV